MDEEPPYLQPGFDPNTLKVAELRGLLLEYDIDYPSSAKKAQLVDIFNEHIASRSRAILHERNLVTASARGIVDVDQFGNEVGVDEPPPPPPSRRAPRRSTRAQATPDDSDAGGAVTVSPVKKTPRRTTSPIKRPSGRRSKVPDDFSDGQAEPEPPRTARKTRRSISRPKTPTPEPKEESEEERQLSDDPEKSPFSDENPFQKGSSPWRKSPKAESRRKSLPRGVLIGEPTPQPSRSSRRQTDFQLPPPREPTPPSSSDNRRTTLTSGPLNAIARPSIKRFEMPLSRLQQDKEETSSSSHDTSDLVPIKKEKSSDDEEDLLAPGEEFTPEGTLEVQQAVEESGAPVRRRMRRKSRPSPVSMIWTVFGAVLVAYFMWWRKEKIEIGYCGVGKTAPKEMNHNSYDQDWTSMLRPECEQCPVNAICKPDFTAECKDDYVLVQNPLSFWGLIPLPPTCEPDTEKLRRIAILSDEAIKILRKRAADVECGEVRPLVKEGEAAPAGDGKDGTAVSAGGKEGDAVVGKGKDGYGDGPVAAGKGVDVNDLRKILYDLKAPKLSDAQFNELWKNALEDVASRDEVEVKEDSATGHLILASTSLAALPLSCSIRLSILRTLNNYRLELLVIVSFILLLVYGNGRLQKRREDNILIKKYVHHSLRLLARKAAVARGFGAPKRVGWGGRFANEKKDVDALDDEDGAGSVAVVQLRDQVLQHEFDPKRRKEIWEGVQRVVECNSNVRATNRDVRGEVMRCWTWIGALASEDGEEEFGRVIA